MLVWRDMIIYGLSNDYPREIVFHILSFLRRESIYQLAIASRNYHIERMPISIRESLSIGEFYQNIQCNDDCEEEVSIYSETVEELMDKWDTIDPKGKEYTYFGVWRWSRFEYPYMNFVYSFNRGRVFLRFLKGYEWYDLYSEDNIVDKLTDYKKIEDR